MLFVLTSQMPSSHPTGVIYAPPPPSGCLYICSLFPLVSVQVEAVAKESSRELSYYKCSVTDPQGVAETFGRFVRTLKAPIRGLVSCAGVSDNGPATEFPIESLRRLLDINVTGTFTVAQAVAKEVRRSNTTASMVFVASMSGHVSNNVSRYYQPQ